MNNVKPLIIIASLSLLIAGNSGARQFRLISPIPTPSAVRTQLPDGAVAVDEVRPISRDEVAPLVGQVLDQWNSNGLQEVLAGEFFDKSRLLDAVDTRVPRDATLRLQSIQGVQTLQQYIQPGENGNRGKQISIVSVTARTQLEFNDPVAGFVRRAGLNEFILKVTQAAAPGVK